MLPRAMSCVRPFGRLTGSASVLLLAPALVAMLVSAASLSHVHGGPEPGFFNQDHDLSTLAGLSGAALSPDVPSTAALVVVASQPLGLGSLRPAAAPRRHADPRAPPVH
jgi:hypothetical protein